VEKKKEMMLIESSVQFELDVACLLSASHLVHLATKLDVACLLSASHLVHLANEVGSNHTERPFLC
jgi:hypothetical protein